VCHGNAIGSTGTKLSTDVPSHKKRLMITPRTQVAESLKASNGEKRRPALQRKLPIANGSFLEAQFKSFADPSAVIHDGQHRALCGHTRQ